LLRQCPATGLIVFQPQVRRCSGSNCDGVPATAAYVTAFQPWLRRPLNIRTRVVSSFIVVGSAYSFKRIAANLAKADWMDVKKAGVCSVIRFTDTAQTKNLRNPDLIGPTRVLTHAVGHCKELIRLRQDPWAFIKIY